MLSAEGVIQMSLIFDISINDVDCEAGCVIDHSWLIGIKVSMTSSILSRYGQ